MDRTKIPKPSQLRPPRPVAILVPISESKLNVPKPAQQAAPPPVRKLQSFALRRRSKSVTDLRPAAFKPSHELQPSAFGAKKVLSREAPEMHEFRKNQIKEANEVRRNKPVDVKRNAIKKDPPRNIATRTAKRPLEKDSSTEEIKPKVARKIPDWDYKTRFSVLNEKYTQLSQELKEAKNQLAELEDIDKRYSRLKEESDSLKVENVSLSRCTTELSKENAHLKTENATLRCQLEELTENHAAISEQYHDLQETEKTNFTTIENLNNKVDYLEKELASLRTQIAKLTEDNERLKDQQALIRLDFDTKTRENEMLQEELGQARVRIDTMERQITGFKSDIIVGEALRRQLHNTVQDLKGNIRVFARVRPPINDEEFQRMQCSINCNDECIMEIRRCRESVSAISGKTNESKQEFCFDRVFPPESTQEEVFEDLAQLVQSALDGYHVCVFAYGQTGSGKTFTMQGEHPDKLGMIPKSIDLIFTIIEKLRLCGWQYTVEASFLEIYNETIRDLLDPESKQSYDIRYNEGRGTTVTNLKIEPIESAKELKSLMFLAQKNRAVATTNYNERSSRSHAVTKIYLQGYNRENQVTYTGSVNLVDLAGSESARTTSSERLTETKNINKSLSTLGNVMLALHSKDQHVPYRNSKLTYLLQSCLGGNSKTLMFVNIAPFEDCYNESINSLRFASKVKEVKTGSKRNKNYSLPPIMAGRAN